MGSTTICNILVCLAYFIIILLQIKINCDFYSKSTQYIIMIELPQAVIHFTFSDTIGNTYLPVPNSTKVI